MALRRGWVVLSATVVGLGGLMAFDQHQFGTPFAMRDANAKLQFKMKRTGAKASAAANSQSGATAQAAPPTTQAQQAAPPTTQAQQAAPPATQQAAPAVTTRHAVGDSADDPYGATQVRVTIKGTTITDVTAVNMPYGDPTSQQISDQIAPILSQQAISAQSAQISGVSGATYTSDAYRQSLQSALDKLNFGK
jgi:uncharacterized protein with FMN-binding domain